MPRQKGTVFSQLEKETLVELVERNRNVLENRCNNAKTIQQKEILWTEITRDFNSRLGVTNRCDKQLKDLWKNIKSKAKTAVATTRREQMRTGGGPPPKAPLSDFDLRVCGIFPSQVQSLSNPYDDDATFHRDSMKEIEPTTATGTSTKTHDLFCTTTATTATATATATTTVASSFSSAGCTGGVMFSVAQTSFQKDTCSAENDKNKLYSATPLLQTNYTSSQPAENLSARNSSNSATGSLKTHAIELMTIEHKEKMKFLKEEHLFKMECLQAERDQQANLYQEKLSLIKLKKQKLNKDLGFDADFLPQENSKKDEARQELTTQKIWNPLF